MCNICDYCDDNGRVVPFVGEAYVCPKCNGTKVLPIVAAEAATEFTVSAPWLMPDGREIPGISIPHKAITPEELEERLHKPGVAAMVRQNMRWHQAPAADANARPKFEIQDETSIICGHVVPGRSAVEGYRAAINWLEHGHGGKVYADIETQPPFEERQAEDRVHRPNIQHISPKQAQMMANAANQKKLSVWYDSKLGVSYNGASNQSEPDILFEKTLDPADICLRIWQEPGAVRETYKILRMVNEAIEEGSITDEHGYQIAQLPLRKQEEALNGNIKSPGKTFFSSSRQMGKSSEWRRYRENFLAQWQSAEAGQNYIDAMAYNRALDPLAVKKFRDEYQDQFRDEKTALFGAMYGNVSSQERLFQSALADAPTLGEIIGLLRVTEGRLSSDAEYFLAAHGGNEDQTKMLGKVRTARVKLQRLEESMLGRIHNTKRLETLLPPRDFFPKYDAGEILRRYDDAKNMQNLRRMNEQAKDRTNVEPMSVEITMQHEFPKRGDLSEQKPVIVDIKVDDESVMNALKMKRQIIEQLRKGMVLDQSDVGRVIRERDELDEEHAKGTGPMPPKELL